MAFSATRLSRKSPFGNTPFRNLTLLFTASSQLFFQLLCATPVLAGPVGGNVVGGQGSINQQGLNTTINQASNRLAIDWQSFNVAENESVQFIQPGRDSVALNRIFDQNPSQILGRIDANGSIVLVNPRGVLFGNSATVNVGGLVASALDIKTNDFMNGDFLFSAVENSDGVVVNRGLLSAATGGSITLLGKRVSNEGLISARLGKVNLAAGSEAVLTFDPAGFIGVEVTKEVLENELGIDSAVLNEGTIRADGGQVLMTAKVSKDLFSNAVNNKGIVRAGSVEKRNGAIFLNGLGGDVVNSGSLDVSATDAGVNGGDVTLSGDNVTHSGIIRADAAHGNAGNIAIDSRGTTLLTENSETSASAIATGKGGTITVLGQHVGLFDQSLITATGFNGGGEVLFGGDEQGLNPDITNADAIYIGENTTINVNATTDGDGGKLIVYADLSAKVYGVLTARGGSQGGNGGFIETSGKQFIDIGTAPDAGAVSGDGGLWLIDPFDLTITANNDTPDMGEDSPFIAGQTASNLDVSTLLRAINDTDVTIRTSPDGSAEPGTEAGDISVDTPIVYDGDTRRTLSLIADRNINVNASITSTGGALDLDLTAGDSAAGITTLGTATNPNVSLETRGGNVVFNGGVNVTTGASITTGNGSVTTNNGNNPGDVVISGTIDTNNTFNVNNTTGNVQILNGASVTARGGIIVTGTADTTTSFQVGDGSAAINTNNNNIVFSETDTIQFLNGSTINTNGGDFTITNGTAFTMGDATAGASVNTNNGDVIIASGVNVLAGSSITTGSGSVTTNNGNNPGDVVISGTIDTNNTFNVNNTTGNVQILNGASVTARGGIIVTGTADTSTSFQVGDATGSAAINTTNNNITFNDTDDIQFLNGSTINTDGGDFTITNGTAFTMGDATAGASVNTNNGDVIIASGVNVLAGSSITTGSGSVTTNDGSNPGNVVISGTIDTDSTFNVNNTTGNVQILNGASVTADGGIIVTGTADTTTSFQVGDGDGSAAINTNNNNIVFSETDNIQFLNGSTINTNGGDLTVTNGTAFTVGSAAAGAAINTNGGDVLVGVSGAVNMAGATANVASITTEGGKVDITAASVGNNIAGNTIDSTGAVGADGGDVEITTNGIGVNDVLNVGRIIADGGTASATANSGRGEDGKKGGDITLNSGTTIEVASLSSLGSDGNDGSNRRRNGGDGGAVNLTGAGNVLIGQTNTTAGNADRRGNGNVDGGNAGNITIASTSGVIKLRGDLTAKGGAADLGSTTLDGQAGEISLNGAVQLLADVAMNASGIKPAIPVLPADFTKGNINFNGTLDGDQVSGSPFDLTLTTENGDFIFNGDVGSQQRLALVDLDTPNDVLFANALSLTANTLTAQNINEFTTKVNGETGVSITTTGLADTVGGAISIGNAGTTEIILGNLNSSGGANTAEAVGRDAGAITLRADDLTVGAILAIGGDSTAAIGNGGQGGSISLTADSQLVAVNGAINNSGGAAIGSGIGGAGAGVTITIPNTNDFTFANNLISKGGSAESGTGGAGGAISITANSLDNGNTLTMSGDVDASGGNATVAGDGGTAGTIGLSSNQNLASGNLTAAGGDTTAGGTAGVGNDVTLNAGADDVITLAGTLSSAGGTDGTVVAAGGDITIQGNARVNDSVTLDTGAGSGDINFRGSLTKGSGNADINVAAGSGDIQFSGNVGASNNRVGTITLSSANNVTSNNPIFATAINQIAGTGKTDFQSTINTNNAAGISLTGNEFDLRSVTTNGGLFTVVADGLIDFRSGTVNTAGGQVSLTSHGASLDLDRTITTSGGDLLVNLDNTNAANNALTISSAMNTGTGDFEATKTGALTITSSGSITTNGATSEVRIVDSGAVDISGGITTGGGKITVTNSGAITVNADVSTASGAIDIADSGAFDLTNNGVVNTAGGNFTLLNSDSFDGQNGRITSAQGNVVINSRGAIQLGKIETTSSNVAAEGTLSATTTGGVITQSENTAQNLVVQGNAAFTANDAAAATPTFFDVTLNNTNNQFGGILDGSVSFNGEAVSLRASSATINLGASIVNGTLNVGEANAIKQSGALVVGDTATFTSGGNAITLDDVNNNFQAGVVLSNSGDNDVQINNAGNLLIGGGGWNLGSGNLSVSANGIEQNTGSGAILQATDAAGAQLTSGNGPILLNNTSNNFNGVVTLNGSSAQASILRDANDLELGASTLGGDLTVNIGNNLTVSGNIALGEQLPEGFGNNALTLNFGINGNGSQLNLQAASFVASNLVVNGNANAAVDTLLMNNGDYEWVIDGANQGYIVDLGATVRNKKLPDAPRDTAALVFSNVEKINGGTGDDTFRLLTGGTISAGIDAGDGNDLIDLRGDTGPITIRIGQDISNGVLNIEGAIGNGENSTLIANNVANTWTINGANDGQLNEDDSDLEFTFENFYHLRGGDDKDAFVFLDGGSIAGSIDAGANQNTALNTLDLSNLAGNYDWNVTNSNAGNVQINGGNTLINSFSAVDVLLGSAGRDLFTMGPGVQLTRIDGNGSEDRIIGGDRNTSWVVNAENAGDVIDDEANGGPVKIYEFQEIENIVGGTGVDNFDVSDANAKIANVDGGGGTSDTLIAGNNNNTWQIDADDNNQLINATANTQTTGFTAVQNLVGGDTGDVFELADQAVVAGTIDGGNGQNHLDMSAYTTDVVVDLQAASTTVVNGGLDAGVSNIGEYSAGSGSDTLSAQNVLNEWIIDNNNAGSINSNAVLFSGFENLQGSNNVDNFVVTASGSVDGVISGGANDDTLSLNYANTNRSFTFNGEAGTNDTVTLIGDTNGGGSTYTHDINRPNEIVNTTTGPAAANAQTIRIQNTALVSDAMIANEITLVGTLADDTIQIGSNGTSNQVAVTGFTPIVFSNKRDVAIQGGGASDSVTGLVAPISANRLTIGSVTTIGTDSQAVMTDVTELQITNAANAVYIEESNGIDLLDSIIGGAFNLTARSGDITASGVLNVTGNAVFTASNGAAVSLLNNANRFASSMTFATNSNTERLGQVALFNSLAVDLGDVTSSGLNVSTAGGDILGNGNLQVSGLSQFDAAAGDVLLTNVLNDLGVLNVNNAGQLDVVDIDNLDIDSLNANTVVLDVGGAINDVNGDAVNIIATTVELQADTGIGHSDGLETSIDSLIVNNTDSGNINIANTGNLIVTEATNTGSLNGDITITAANLTLNGDANSSGAANFSAQNQLQQQADITAVNGVSLSAADVTQSGNINVSNTSANVSVTSNRGNITMVDGFVTRTTGGNITYTADANVTVSTLDAIYGGGDVRISSATGSILAARDPVRTLPNVSANNATFIAPTGSLGTPERPLVINARNVFIQTVTSAPPVFTTRPDRIEDLSRVLLGVNEAKAEVGGNQRTEVDSLAIIDPAIFTQVKNYREDDNAVKLPEDQLYRDDDEDEDDKRADPDIFESEKPYDADSASVKDNVDDNADQEPVSETE